MQQTVVSTARWREGCENAPQTRIQHHDGCRAAPLGISARRDTVSGLCQHTCSPQLEMFHLDDGQWLKVYQRSYQRRKRRVLQAAEQLPLSGLRTSALLVCYFLDEEVGSYFFPHVSTVM